jgi:hypothetical protein
MNRMPKIGDIINFPVTKWKTISFDGQMKYLREYEMFLVLDIIKDEFGSTWLHVFSFRHENKQNWAIDPNDTQYIKLISEAQP